MVQSNQRRDGQSALVIKISTASRLFQEVKLAPSCHSRRTIAARCLPCHTTRSHLPLDSKERGDYRMESIILLASELYPWIGRRFGLATVGNEDLPAHYFGPRSCH